MRNYNTFRESREAVKKKQTSMAAVLYQIEPWKGCQDV